MHVSGAFRFNPDRVSAKSTKRTEKGKEDPSGKTNIIYLHHRGRKTKHCHDTHAKAVSKKKKHSKGEQERSGEGLFWGNLSRRETMGTQEPKQGEF